MNTRLPAFRLVGDHVSGETVQALEKLLEHAKRGEVIGIAFCAMYRKRQYIASTAGEARRSPTFALGMLEALQFKLAKMVSRAP